MRVQMKCLSAISATIAAGACAQLPPTWPNVTTRCASHADAPSEAHESHAQAEPLILSNEDHRRLAAVGHRALSSVVRVTTTPRTRPSGHDETSLLRNASLRFGGSGVVISEAGVILTAEHVVRDAAAVSVMLGDGSEREVRRIVTAPGLDLALLAIDSGGLRPLRTLKSPVRRGTAVVALSAANPLEFTLVRPGVVLNAAASLQDQIDSAAGRDYRNLIESTTRLDRGFSGGPLIDAQGRLVGINVAAVDGATEAEDGRGYAIPLSAATGEAVAKLHHELTSPVSVARNQER